MNMKKFIITGIPRSGTTVISCSVVTHPEILFYGELFNSMMGVRTTEASRTTLGAGWKFERPLNRGIPACSDRISAQDYLKDFFSRDIPYNAVGFKILYDQAIEGPNSDTWEYVANDPEIKIIRTRRTDLLEVVCSYVRAKITRRWHIAGDQSLESPRFIVPPAEFENLIKKLEAVPEPALRFDKTHDVLDIGYDQISMDFQDSMTRIFSFLGVDSNITVEPKLKKIARMKPYEELANYQDLKRHFSNTPRSKYFVY